MFATIIGVIESRRSAACRQTGWWRVLPAALRRVGPAICAAFQILFAVFGRSCNAADPAPKHRCSEAYERDGRTVGRVAVLELLPIIGVGIAASIVMALRLPACCIRAEADDLAVRLAMLVACLR